MARHAVLCYFINVDWYFDLHWLSRARHAQENGFSVHIITTFTNKKLKKKLDELGFTTHHISLNRKSVNPFKLLHTFIQAREIISRIKPDILHCITIKPNILGGFIARELGIPVIFSITGSGLAFSSSSYKMKALRTAIKYLYRISHKKNNSISVFEHHHDQNLFVQAGICSTSNSLVIPGAGIDLKKFTFSHLPNNQTYKILFASRMLWDKGIQYAIAASNKLKAKGYDVKLEVAGILDSDAQTAISIDQINQWHNKGEIHWLGQINDIESLLKSADLVILPTYYGEGIPRILIEASATGRPCITTDTGGCTDIVINNETGFIIPQHNVEALAEKIETLIKSPDLSKKFSFAARKHSEIVFDEVSILKNTLNLYFKILNPSYI
jgi:glycosyltransferase involved in cell wall biosynthesis